MSEKGHSRPVRTGRRSSHFRLSNRPFRVKLLQTIHHYSVDVAHGLALLFGFGTKALPAWDSKTRRNNLLRDLAGKLNGRFTRTCDLTSPIVPRGTLFHHLVELECPPIAFDLPRLSCCCGFFPGPPELSAINPDAVHNHGQPSR